MQRSVTISVVGHGLFLGSTLLWFSFNPPPATPQDAVMVDVVSLNDFSHITAGSRTAPKAETPKPIVDKIGDPQQAKDPAPKVVEKPEVKTETKAAPKPPDPKPKPAEHKTDEIADALKKEQKKPDPKPKKPQPKLEFSQIENKLALLDKRDPQRQSITGATLNSTASLGTESGAASELDVRWQDMLSTYLNNCWQLPDWAARRVVFFDVRMSLKQDGSLAAEPVLLSKHDDMAFPIASETALRAIHTCAPFRFLPVARYERWREVTIAFDTRALRQLRNIAAQ